MRILISTALLTLGLSACAAVPVQDSQIQKTLTLSDGAVFPADRALMRPEDGVALGDGTLIVADRRHGLIALSPNGSHRPFGAFSDAGYVYAPPSQNAGPNGVAFGHEGRHIFVADIVTGSIYRTDIQTEKTARIYQHRYGVNSAHTDSTGALWFTQSTENEGPNSEARMFAALDRPAPDGAIYRVAPASNGEFAPAAEVKATGLNFANGFVIDEARGAFYVSETVADHISVFQLNPKAGTLTDRRVLAEIVSPDNLEMDKAGIIWVASPGINGLLTIDPKTGNVQTAFREKTAENESLLAEWKRRGAAGEPRAELIAPAMWGSMPGLVTGVIFAPGSGAYYVTGLGDALVKVEP